MNFTQYADRRISNEIDIYEFPISGQEFLIGHTMKWCNELESAYNEALQLLAQNKKEKDELFDELVTHGHRVKPKTQEEINVELMQALQESINMTKKLTEKFEKQEEELKKLKEPITKKKEV